MPGGVKCLDCGEPYGHKAECNIRHQCEACGGAGGHFATCTVAYDPVSRPSHYLSGGIETIDFIEAKELNYHLGNVVKYITRAGKKSDAYVEDLQKARWYLERAIEKADK